MDKWNVTVAAFCPRGIYFLPALTGFTFSPFVRVKFWGCCPPELMHLLANYHTIQTLHPRSSPILCLMISVYHVPPPRGRVYACPSQSAPPPRTTPHPPCEGSGATVVYPAPRLGVGAGSCNTGPEGSGSPRVTHRSCATCPGVSPVGLLEQAWPRMHGCFRVRLFAPPPLALLLWCLWRPQRGCPLMRGSGGWGMTERGRSEDKEEACGA